jgi:hypothetical protein
MQIIAQEEKIKGAGFIGASGCAFSSLLAR